MFYRYFRIFIEVLEQAAELKRVALSIWDSRRRVVFYELWNARNAHFPTSGHLSASLPAGPGTGKSGADSAGYEHGRGMAGLGYTRAKTPRPDARLRDVGLRALRYPFSKLWRTLLLRPIRLVIHPTKVPLPIQGSHFLQRQSRFLPIPAAAPAIIRRKQFRSHSARKRISVARRPAMAYRSFRSFLDALEQAGELKRVAIPVDTDLLIAEWADREMKSPGGGKALLFEQAIVDGKKIRIPGGN